mgnify:FL=1
MGKVSDAAIQDEATLYPYIMAAEELLNVYPQLYKQKLLDAKLKTAYTVDEEQLYVDLLISIIHPFVHHLNLNLHFGIDSVIKYHRQEQNDRSPV